MTQVPPAARRGRTLAANLSLTDRLFSSGADRRLAAIIEDGLERLEKRLTTETKFSDALAQSTARYLLEAGGKRVRPVLAFLTSQLGDGITDDVIAASVSIELTHLATLYHDDVMDEAEKRRGVPTAHTVWSNSVAILTGDLLFARASKILAELGERAVRLQAATFERLCLGQLHETMGPQEGDNPIEHYLDVLADKTGSLIAASARLGVIFSGAPAEYEQAVVDFGERIGVAFQLVDDVIDLAPPEDSTGKRAGTDLRAGVATLPALYLASEAEHDREAAELANRIAALGRGELSDAEGDEVIAALREHSVTARTRAEADRWARSAVEALDPLPDGQVKKTLIRFADTVVERTS